MPGDIPRKIDNAEPADAESRAQAGYPTDDFLERPAFSFSSTAEGIPRFSAGNRLLDRFEIVRLIGRGGMGEVYEAIDAELGIPVALKTILTHIAVDHRAIAKIRAEVRQARAIAHPNVCRVYDLFTVPNSDAPVQFLTMELLRGRTLAERLKKDGPLTPSAAIPLARDIAAALDATHLQQIVHRDLKPGNVILTETEDRIRAVVTDFGLSVRVSASDRRVTLSDAAAGTEDYVAPEQRAGQVIGPTADIYAFGVVLYEMLTGRPPRAGVPLDESQLPLPWRRAIAACLQVDPAARPLTATNALEMAVGSGRSGGRRLAVGTIALGLIALALYQPASRFYGVRNGSGGLVMVGEVVNETSDPDLSAVTDILKHQLEQSPVLVPLSQERLDEIMRQMTKPQTRLTPELAREAAWRASAHGIVTGRLRGGPSNYILTVRFEQRGATPAVVGSVQVRSFESRDRDELRGAVRSAARWLRLTAGEPGNRLAEADRPVEDVTSNSWRAVALFSQAQGLIAASRHEDGLALLSEAVRIDPDFALAWMRMGDVLMTFRRSEEAYEKWNRALQVLDRRRLSPREEYRIRGMFASDTDDYAGADRVYRLYMVSYPSDFAPYFYIARPLLMLGRTDEAIQMLREAQKRDPSQYSVPAQLAMFKFRAGRWQETGDDIATVRRLGQAVWADCLDGQREFLRGNYHRALELFTSLAQSDNTLLRARAPLLRAGVLADLGRVRPALEVLREGADVDASQGDRQARADKLLASAELALRLGDRRGCRDFCIQVEQFDRSPLRLAHTAALFARAGATKDAERVLSALPTNPRSRKTLADRLRVEGEILLARGELSTAWTRLQRAASFEPPGVLNEYLARAAAAVGETGTAIALYEQMATEPGYYWRYPSTDPGRWYASIEAYLDLTGKIPTGRTPAVAATYRALRSVQINQP